MSAAGSPWKCFTVSGEIGSGKSSVARLLAARTGAEYHSTGSLQRHLASERSMSTLEMNLLSETDATIDEEVDGFTRELAASGRDFVIDSRLAWHFVPEALKIFLLVDTNLAVERVLGDQPSRSESESYGGPDEAVRDIRARQESERRRFIGTYGVDLFRWSNYNLVIETSRITPERTVELILEHRADDQPRTTRFWLSPRSIYPTAPVEVTAGAESAGLLDSMRRDGFDTASPLRIVASRDRGLYVLEGHRRLSCALRLGLAVVPCRLAGQGDDEIAPGTTVAEMLAAKPLAARIRDWEESHDFRFSSHPDGQPEPLASVEES